MNKLRATLVENTLFREKERFFKQAECRGLSRKALSRRGKRLLKKNNYFDIILRTVFKNY